MKPKLALGEEDSPYFHPWAHTIAREAQKGAQGDPKDTKIRKLGRKFAPRIVKNVPKLVPKSQNGVAT